MVAQGQGRSRGWSAAVGTVTAVGSLLLLATGCSENGSAAASDKPRPGAREAVRSVPDVLAQYGSSRNRTLMTMTSGGTRISVDGEGVFDYRRRLGQLTVRLPEGTSGAEPGEHRSVTEIVVPQALFMKNRGAGVPADKWVRVDTTTLADGNLVTAGATDPVSAAELLRGAREVTYEGVWRPAGRRGVQSGRHYSGTVDLRAAARRAAPHWREQLAAAARGFTKRTVPFDAYVDGQGRLRKVRHEFTFAADAQYEPGRTEPGGSGSGEVAVSSTTWFDGFGEPVKVEMPEQSDIYAGKIAPF